MVFLEASLISDSAIRPYAAFQESILRFSEVLVLFVLAHPRSARLEAIATQLGRSENEVSKVTGALLKLGLIRCDEMNAKRWILACRPEDVTLESVLACAIPQLDFARLPSCSQLHGIEEFLVPAFMSAAQNLRTTLRQFSLDRVRCVIGGKALVGGYTRSDYAGGDHAFSQ